MTAVTRHRLGEPCWVDYASTDVPATREFYTGLFGWKAEIGGGEFGGYITFLRDGRPVAGLGSVMGDQQGDTWLTYLMAEDADATERAAKSAGADVLSPVMTVGDKGRLAVISDPGGAVVGLWEPGEHHGFGLTAEVGAPAWHELYARSYAAQLAFYTSVFRWNTQVLGDTADFRYTTFGPAEAPAGGVYDADKVLPESVPSHWLIYFGVADADTASGRVQELGGSVVRDPWDSEFGRLAQVTDPLGAIFLVHQVRER